MRAKGVLLRAKGVSCARGGSVPTKTAYSRYSRLRGDQGRHETLGISMLDRIPLQGVEERTRLTFLAGFRSIREQTEKVLEGITTW